MEYLCSTGRRYVRNIEAESHEVAAQAFAGWMARERYGRLGRVLSLQPDGMSGDGTLYEWAVHIGAKGSWEDFAGLFWTRK